MPRRRRPTASSERLRQKVDLMEGRVRRLQRDVQKKMNTMQRAWREELYRLAMVRRATAASAAARARSSSSALAARPATRVLPLMLMPSMPSMPRMRMMAPFRVPAAPAPGRGGGPSRPASAGLRRSQGVM